MGLVAPRHAGSFRIRDWTCVSCIGRWILYSWATKEATLLGFFGSELCPVKMESCSPVFQRPEPCPRGTGWSSHLGTWLHCSGLCLSELPEWLAGLSGPHRAPVGPWAWGMPSFCVVSCRRTGHPGPGVSSFLWRWSVHVLHCPRVGEGNTLSSPARKLIGRFFPLTHNAGSFALFKIIIFIVHSVGDGAVIVRLVVGGI